MPQQSHSGHIEIETDTTPMNNTHPIGETDTSAWPRFAAISEPKMVGLYVGNGSTSKPYQAFLDGHPQMYGLPAYPLLYFYPHWNQWREEMTGNWNWAAIIDAFCKHHASVLDSRLIPGFNGLTTLGENQNEYLFVEGALFRAFLLHLLEGEAISSRTFLLSIHYAYAFCQGEDLGKKRVLLYHIHVPEYIHRYLAPDFPDLLTIGLTRDPRSNIKGRFKHSYQGVDDIRLDRTDAVIFRRRTYYFICELLLDGLEGAKDVDPSMSRCVRAEDLHYRLEEVLRASVDFLGLDPDPCLGVLTFGGLAWWGDGLYDMKPMNTFNPRIVSKDWQKTLSVLDWFVLEGLLYDNFQKYGYETYKFKKDSLFFRMLLVGAILLPSRYERDLILDYLNPKSAAGFVKAAWREATGRTPIKDYSFNAYYRHKFLTRDLKLWKGRWYKKLAQGTQRLAAENPQVSWPSLLAGAGAIVYSVVNLGRYVWSIALMPVMILKRIHLMLRTLRRRLFRSTVLPDAL